MSIISDLLRSSFGRSDAARDAGLTTPEDVVRYDGIRYGDDPRWQTLDVYRPRAAGDGVLPVIVSVHGGGWVYGDKTVYQFYCMSLAQRGFAVVNFSYRLAPETNSQPSWRMPTRSFTGRWITPVRTALTRTAFLPWGIRRGPISWGCIAASVPIRTTPPGLPFSLQGDLSRERPR